METTGAIPTKQKLFSCLSCGLDKGKVCCFSCVSNCHKGHLVKQVVGDVSGYCDCNTLTNGCSLLKKPQNVIIPTRNTIVPPQKKIASSTNIITNTKVGLNQNQVVNKPKSSIIPVKSTNTLASSQPTISKISSFGLTVSELKNICKERNISGHSNMKKDQLILCKKNILI